MPKTLTRTQFQSLRPKGRKKWNYQNYLAYVAQRRPKADPVMEAAAAMVASQMGSAKADYDAAAKARMRDAMAASEAAKGFTAAFGRATQDIPNVTGSAYQAAANALAGFSGGLEGRALEIANQAGSTAAGDVARMSGAAAPAMPSAAGVLHTPASLAAIDAATFVGRAPYVTNSLNAQNTAGKLQLANWADLQRYHGVKEAAAIRDKFLAEAGKRPALIQQAYLALRKDKREARAMDITAAKMRLDQARLNLDRADSKAERDIAQKEYDLAAKELGAKIKGEGYYEKFPPGSSSPAKNRKDHAKAVAKRDEILGEITGNDGLSFARKAITDKYGGYTFGYGDLPRQRLIRLMASTYWPRLQGYAGPGSQKALNAKMMEKIVKMVDVLAQQFPQLKKGYKKPPKDKPEDEGNGDETPSSDGNPWG